MNKQFLSAPQRDCAGVVARGCMRAFLLIGISVGLAACGGGGNSPSSPNPPPATPPPPSPPPPQDPPDIDIHLSLTNTYEARSAGLTGAGIRIAVVDTGVKRDHPALDGRVIGHQIYVDPNRNDLSVDDKVGHGTWVSQILAGEPFGQWPGGIAPGALLISARIVGDERPDDDGSGQGNQVGVDAAQFFEFLNGNLVSSNARIQNNSWGGLYWNSQAVTQAFYDAYRGFVHDHGGLVVFATGNSSFATPSDTAALPSKHPLAASLEQGWLAVAALDSNNPDQLASYSNACGAAKNYCLVAPGRVVVTGLDDTPDDPSYWIIAGTSLAAPQVSGAAALVWEAFPYFDNDLVRQTLLGTATDMGESGPDEVFGYGLLNVGKAVKGPGLFDWGDVTVNFAGLSQWSNAIQGEGGLVKRGSGTLVLGHDGGGVQVSGYQGDTRVEGGTLGLVDSGLSHSNVFVGAGGSLSLANGGTDQAIDNAGTVNLLAGDNWAGTFTHRSNATLGVRVGSLLEVQGDMTIEGGNVHILGTVPGYVSSNEEKVVHVFGVLGGEFDDLTVADGVFFEGRLFYEVDSIWLEIQRLDVSAAGLNITGASVGSATRLDGAFANLDRWMSNPEGGDIDPGVFLTGAGLFQRAPDKALAELSVGSLSGEIHATQLTAIQETIDAGARALGERLATRLSGLDDPFMSSAWAGSLNHSGALSAEGFSQARLSLGGTVVGFDQTLGDEGLVGLSLSKARLDAGLSGLGGESRSLIDEAALYAGWSREGRYVHGRLAQGRINQQLQRRVLLGTRLGGVATQYRANYSSLGLEAGSHHAWAGLAVNPFVSSQWVSLSQDGFGESGAYGFGLRADGQAHRFWQAGAGVDVSREWFQAGGASHRVAARLQWQRALRGADAGVEASFSGLDAFAPVHGIGMPRDRALLDVGLESKLTPSSTLGFGLQREFSGRNVPVQLEASLRIGF